MSHNQTFFELLADQTPPSIPVRNIFVTICMNKLQACLVGKIWAFLIGFRFFDSTPAQQRNWLSEARRILNTSRDSCLQFGTLYEKIIELDPQNKMEQIFAYVFR